MAADVTIVADFLSGFFMLSEMFQRSAMLLFIVTFLTACDPDQASSGVDVPGPTAAGAEEDGVALSSVVSEVQAGPQALEDAEDPTDAEVAFSADPDTIEQDALLTDVTVTVTPMTVTPMIGAPDKSQTADGVDEGEADADQEDIDAYQPLEDVRLLQDSATVQRKTLDLTLPNMNWDADDNTGDFNRQRMPDVFRYQKTESGMNLSGKLHWDEDEEATHMSLEESIKGAEVELQFRLP